MQNNKKRIGEADQTINPSIKPGYIFIIHNRYTIYTSVNEDKDNRINFY